VKLFLSHNNIDDVGAKLIADALKNNHSLNTLDLMVNNIGDDGVIAIADALKVNFSLDKLNLLANENITARGKEYFANPYIHVAW
jgi:Ran GTPase-activating protein (RanGAP) involved in mRNA processing and transport